MDRFDKQVKSTLHFEGVQVNTPLIIEVVNTQEKLEPMSPDLKLIVGDNGLVTTQETYVIEKFPKMGWLRLEQQDRFR
ncbi:MAG TPA: DUF190 domain-containing protein [Candidatus Binatia bacterium]|nr:DUF190 domain-containing protein [Candidatus Binatia bacterium]